MPWPTYIEVDHYEELRPRGRGGADQRGIRHHRLIAYAHGKITSLGDPREVDHKIPIRWLNFDDNLQALDPAEHARLTNERAAARKARAATAPAQAPLQVFADGGTIECPACGTSCETTYRCGECGRDLVDEQPTDAQP